jgi:hypothetical protein
VEIRDRTACFVKKRTGETHGRQRELIKSPGLCGSAFFGKFYVLNNVVLLIKGLWKIMKEKNEEKKRHTWEAKGVNGTNSNVVWGTPANTHCIGQS